MPRLLLLTCFKFVGAAVVCVVDVACVAVDVCAAVVVVFASVC